MWYRSLLDWPDRLAGRPVKDVGEGLLTGLRQCLDRHAIDHDVNQVRGAREVVVPDAVMHRLEVPLAFASPDIDRDDALSKEVVAGPVPTVVIAGRGAGLVPSDVIRWIPEALLETTTAVSELELPFVIFDTDPLS